jgi:hypothetical protein
MASGCCHGQGRQHFHHHRLFFIGWHCEDREIFISEKTRKQMMCKGGEHFKEEVFTVSNTESGCRIKLGRE